MSYQLVPINQANTPSLAETGESMMAILGNAPREESKGMHEEDAEILTGDLVAVFGSLSKDGVYDEDALEIEIRKRINRAFIDVYDKGVKAERAKRARTQEEATE